MSVRIRFQRVGMPKQPHFRLVAVDRRRAGRGAELEILGNYDPRSKENTLNFNPDRVQHWLSKGAQASETVKILLTRSGFFKKSAAKTDAPS